MVAGGDLVLMAVALSLIFFFYLGYRARLGIGSNDDFFFAGRTASPVAFFFTWFASTIAFASAALYYMQVSALWGYWVLVGSIGTYAFGQWAALSIALKSKVDFNTFDTVGGLIEGRTGSATLGKVVDYMNALSSGSLVYIELGLGVALFSFLFPDAPVAFAFFILIALSLICFAYISLGGFRAVLESDVWQGILIIIGLIALMGVATSLLFANLESARPALSLAPTVGSDEIIAFLLFALIANATLVTPQIGIWQRLASTGNSAFKMKVGAYSIAASAVVFALYVLIAGVYQGAGQPISSPADIFAPVTTFGDLGVYVLQPLIFLGLFAALISSADSSAIAAATAVFGHQSQQSTGDKINRSRFFLLTLFATVIGCYALATFVFDGFMATFLPVIFWLFSQLSIVFPAVLAVLLYPERMRSPRSMLIGLGLGWLSITIGTLTPLFGTGTIGGLWGMVVGFALCMTFTFKLGKN